MALVAALVCFASGFALLALDWRRRGSFATDLLLRSSLSVGFSLGIFSFVYFFALVCHFRNLLLIDVIVFVVLIAARAVQFRLGLVKPEIVVRDNQDNDNDDQWPDWFRHILTAAFVIALFAAVYSALVRMLAFPHGDGWDAFAIWNLHARFLFLGGAHWRDGFTPLVGGSHPDYPLLLPAAIAHFWIFIGHDDPRVPAVIGIVFTFSTIGVLFAALSILRGRMSAMMGAIALLATPFFIEQGMAQYADVPLSFFFLATVVLFCLFDGQPEVARRLGLLVLAGLAAGFAAWTKNEGLLFLIAIAVSRLLIFIRRPKKPENDIIQTSPAFWVTVVPLLASLLPGLLLVAYYKHSIGVPGDLFSGPATVLPKLLDPARYWVIFAGYVKGFFRFGHWLWIPGTVLLIGLTVVFGRNKDCTRQLGFRTSVLALTLTLVGYFAVFLITPYDIHWHLRFSLVRLFLQLWPSTVFLSFLMLQGTSAPPNIV
jgi:hypothetical protein